MNYEYVYTPDILDETLFKIRDVKDYPVLYTAILEDVDILVTGDSDFSDVDVKNRWAFCCTFYGMAARRKGHSEYPPLSMRSV